MNCIHRASSHAVGRRTDVRGEFHPRRVRETRLGKLHAGMIATSSSPEVRSPRSLRALVVTSLLLASLLCACSQVQARGGRSTLTPSRAVLAMLSSKSSLSRPELARRDAARLLTLVRLPPESRRLAQAPRSDAKILSSPAQSLGDPDLVDLHRFFVAQRAHRSCTATRRVTRRLAPRAAAATTVPARPRHLGTPMSGSSPIAGFPSRRFSMLAYWSSRSRLCRVVAARSALTPRSRGYRQNPSTTLSLQEQRSSPRCCRPA